jgi:3-oxoacyl-[acyl-carrier protein] reductase
VISTNLTGVFHFCRACLPLFRKRGGGQVINISSLAGKNPFAGGAAYNASKFGLNGFTEAMMLDHRHENIRVSLIAPGSVDTEFSPRAGSGDWKIAPADIAEVVLAILTMPARTLVSLVEMRPAKPKKA